MEPEPDELDHDGLADDEELDDAGPETMARFVRALELQPLKQRKLEEVPPPRV